MYEAPTCDPSPMTREGTRSLVERFYAMRRDGQPEAVAGGVAVGGSPTSPIPLGPKKIKSDWTKNSDKQVILTDKGSVVVPLDAKKIKRHSHLWHSCEICDGGYCVVPISFEVIDA